MVIITFSDFFHFPWLFPDHYPIPRLFHVFQVSGHPEQKNGQIKNIITLSIQCEIPSQFPDGWRHSSVALGMLSVTHITPVLVLNTCMDSNMQHTINSFRQLLPDIFSLTIPWFLVKSLTFPWQLSNSLTFLGFPDKWSPCIMRPPTRLA